jgi:carboxylesterase
MTNTSSSSATWKKIVKWVGIGLLALVAIFLLMGIIPIRITEIPSTPNPAQSYEEAMARWDTLVTPTEEEGGELMSPLADSFLLEHGQKTDRVYVLVHGLTNSPHQWEPFAKELYDKGYNVLVVRMPYHGLKSHSVGELKHLTPELLANYMDDVTDVAVGFGDDVRIIGISVGGTAAAWAAQNRPDAELVMLVSPMFGMGVLPDWGNKFMMNFFSRFPNINLPDPTEPEREHVYRGQSTRGVAVSIAFGQSVMKQAESTPPAVKDIILVTNANDTTVSNEDAYKIADIWEQNGANVTRYEFPKELGLPHNSIDTTSTEDTQIVYDKLLELLGEE